MRDSVRQAWDGTVGSTEGHTTWMYLDTHDPPLVTVGKGNLVDPVDLALELPWQRTDGTLATADEVRDEHAALKAHGWTNRPASAQKDATTLRLSEQAVDELVGRRLGEFWNGLLRMFDAAEAWPAPAQLAALLVAWALGLGELRRAFPHLCAALVAQDWEMAARECRISTARAERNELHRRLFLAAAAGGDPDDLPVNLPGLD